MVEDTIPQDENLRLAELRFRASQGDQQVVPELKKALIDRKALPFYQIISTELVSSFPRRLTL